MRSRQALPATRCRRRSRPTISDGSSIRSSSASSTTSWHHDSESVSRARSSQRDCPRRDARKALMYRLPDVSLLNPVLDLAIDIDVAIAGTVQVYIAERQELHIVAQRGFREPFLQHFRVVVPN